MPKKSSVDLADLAIYGVVGAGGVILLSELFKSFGSQEEAPRLLITPTRLPVTPTAPQVTPVAPTTEPAVNVEKIGTLTSGAPYDINSALVPGYTTIVLFAADWCPGCQELKPQLYQIVNSRPDVALRLVDLTDRNSAAAAQAAQEFNLTGIPYVRIYGPSGAFLGEVTGPNIDQVQAIIQ